MAIVYLIRHGQASFGKDNYDELSELGVKQANRLGEVLGQRIPQFDGISLGDLKRHQQTATHCLKGFGIDFSADDECVDSGWNEYHHQEILRVYNPIYESATSMMAHIRQHANPKDFFEREFNAAIHRWIAGEHNADYSESWIEFKQRVHAAFDSLLMRHRAAKQIAVFTSGGPISLISQALLGVKSENIMHLNWTLMNCGVTKIVTTGSRRFVASLNEHTHFEGVDYKHLITYT